MAPSLWTHWHHEPSGGGARHGHFYRGHDGPHASEFLLSRGDELLAAAALELLVLVVAERENRIVAGGIILAGMRHAVVVQARMAGADAPVAVFAVLQDGRVLLGAGAAWTDVLRQVNRAEVGILLAAAHQLAVGQVCERQVRGLGVHAAVHLAVIIPARVLAADALVTVVVEYRVLRVRALLASALLLHPCRRRASLGQHGGAERQESGGRLHGSVPGFAWIHSSCVAAQKLARSRTQTP
mmetsp:Transcript_3131/g.8422  ORF Transcript_3131/g.8422 Transcript_3131/m.8422 type:complete len:241 (-) Transcript_3131:7-729(-)